MLERLDFANFCLSAVYKPFIFRFLQPKYNVVITLCAMLIQPKVYFPLQLFNLIFKL